MNIIAATDRELLVILAGLKYLADDLDGLRTRREAVSDRRHVRQFLLGGQAPSPEFIDELSQKLILGSLDQREPERPKVLITVAMREVTYRARGDVEVRLIDLDTNPNAKPPKGWRW